MRNGRRVRGPVSIANAADAVAVDAAFRGASRMKFRKSAIY